MAGRTLRAVLVAVAVQGAGAAIAGGAGLPVLGFWSAAHGVRTPDDTRRYLARPGQRETVVRAVSPSGRILARAVLEGRFAIPVVAYDGSAAGLSANGRTLVLVRPRLTFPQRSTELAILAARTLAARRFERLRGDFGFDAISPNGEWLYLIEYTSRFDPTRYRVRALSMRTGKLLQGDIVDPHNPGEAMRGSPITRLSSPDGRWAYTLYDGNGHPFIHALDTARLHARCIDIAAFPTATNSWDARLRLAGRRLMIVLGGRTSSEVDTRSLSLVAPTRTGAPTVADTAARASRARTRGRSEGVGVALPIAAALLILAAAILTVRRRVAARPRRASAR